MTRIYLPATAADLAELNATGVLPVGDAYTVTDGLRAELADGAGEADDESCEYTALTSAAYASLFRIAEHTGTARRRVVVAADVPPGTVRGVELALVEVTTPVELAAVAAVHVDADVPEVTRLVTEAAAAIAADEDAEATADSLDGHDLEWYAPSELGDLVDSLS
ncbi:DUF6912 family protein [Phytomonospora endophytica]|uniref:Uncharacterized protein n=1 Tax=Phytomonospora endophytica TaxID=714109 RepID=A0A841FV51_9ACTN|nr:hypothetical protein [Phytomonospora endophytica]MBB6039654.1 hypothetical protein [Phytomonospora endophytica]